MSQEQVGAVKAGAKNKLTTGAGLVGGIPVAVSEIVALVDKDPATVFDWRALVVAIAVIVIGLLSRDANKSSEASGAQ